MMRPRTRSEDRTTSSYGDDIAGARRGPDDGRFSRFKPEFRCLGVAKDTNETKPDRAAPPRANTKHVTNVAPTMHTPQVWGRVSTPSRPDAGGATGRRTIAERPPGCAAVWAHPKSRVTTTAGQLPNVQPTTTDPGRPIDAIISADAPADRDNDIRAITDLAEGVYEGSPWLPRKPRAEGVDGQLRYDPMSYAPVMSTRRRIRSRMAENSSAPGGGGWGGPPTSDLRSRNWFARDHDDGHFYGPATATTCAHCSGSTKNCATAKSPARHPVGILPTATSSTSDGVQAAPEDRQDRPRHRRWRDGWSAAEHHLAQFNDIPSEIWPRTDRYRPHEAI